MSNGRFFEYQEGPYEGTEVICMSCDARDPEGYYRTERNSAHGNGPVYLCQVCWSTFCSLPFLYPTQSQSPRTVLTAMAQCTNLILRAIEDRFPTPTTNHSEEENEDD